MKAWLQVRDTFLEETIRQAGLGDTTRAPCCCNCGQPGRGYGNLEDTGGERQLSELYCCQACEEFVEYKACCMKRHEQTPLHCVEVSQALYQKMYQSLIVLFSVGIGSSGRLRCYETWGTFFSSDMLEDNVCSRPGFLR